LITHLLLSLLLFTGSSGGQAKAPVVEPKASVPAMLLEITLERKRDGKVETMAAGHVFDAGDQVRLRLKSHYDGFLYVMDQGTSGQFATVFPAPDAGTNNRIEVEKEYYVPSGNDEWFDVTGPAGFDTLYFMLSPVELARPAITSFTAPGPLSSLRPRCNDKIFRARGECMDDSAGPAAVPAGQALPAPLAPIAGSASRDIVFSKKSGGAVGVSGGTSAPVLYTYRLAHGVPAKKE
jgi:Domain of unknown function (DUF4384)